MKTFYSCLFIITFFISCDEGSTLFEPNTSKAALYNRNVMESPINSDNSFDGIGLVFGEVYDAYYATDTLPSSDLTIVKRINSVSALNDGFKDLKTSSYSPISLSNIQNVVTCDTLCLSAVLNASSLTAAGKLSLATLIDSVLFSFDTIDDYLFFYDKITDYEDIIQNDLLLTSSDKEIILITTSIVRHSVYRAKKKPKKNKDPDWKILVGHIAAAVDGAESSSCDSILWALAAGIIQNQQ